MACFGPSELLATIVLGNTIANGAIVALGVWPALAGYWPLFPTLVGLVLLILFGCEVFPKTLAVRSPERWALRVARPMLLIEEATGWFQRLVQRFNVWLLNVVMPKSIRPLTGVTDEEYQELIELGVRTGHAREVREGNHSADYQPRPEDGAGRDAAPFTNGGDFRRPLRGGDDRRGASVPASPPADV